MSHPRYQVALCIIKTEGDHSSIEYHQTIPDKRILTEESIDPGKVMNQLKVFNHIIDTFKEATERYKK